MNPSLKQNRWWPLLAVAAYFGVATLFAQAPAWWASRGVLLSGPGVVTNDFSLVNQGQVKWLATQAAAELDEDLQFIGGAGTGITALVSSFSTNNNYRPVNAGQLKNTVAPFYERLFALDLTNCYPQGAGRPYPWSGSTNPARDFSLVNAGQTKYVFSFDTAVDSDGDGIPDIWEKNLGTNPYLNDASAINTNAWAQGMTNSDLYQNLHTLTIPNAWAVYTNTTQVAVVADIRSLNRYLTVKAAEFFLDSTNGITFGAGTAMSAVDGAFNSTNEMAQAIFTPSFPAGERHELFIHAQDSANHWCPFVKVILNPNINDILDRIQANYSAIHDLQFDSSDTMLINEVVQSSVTFHVKQKGAYKYRTENAANGSVEIANHNFDVKLNAGQQIISYRVTSGADNFAATVAAGPAATPDSDQLEDFCWDIPTFRQAHAIVLDGNAVQGSNSWYYLVATANDATETIRMGVDYKRGVAFSRTISPLNVTPVVSQLSNVIEISPGIWLPLSQADTMTLLDGTVLKWQRILSTVQANKGLDDSNFAVPPPP